MTYEIAEALVSYLQTSDVWYRSETCPGNQIEYRHRQTSIIVSIWAHLNSCEIVVNKHVPGLNKTVVFNHYNGCIPKLPFFHELMILLTTGYNGQTKELK